MNLEQLQAMSDSELNELSAVKVMGKIYQNGHIWEKVEGKGINGHRCLGDWNPCSDMNDALVLMDKFNYSKLERNHSGGWIAVIEASAVFHWDAGRAITIASILAK